MPDQQSAVLPTVEETTDGPFVPAVPFPARTVRVAGIVLVLVAVLTVGELVAFGANYLLHDRFYVTTANAQVDGDQIEINAPSSGNLLGSNLDQGSAFRRGAILGRVAAVGGGPQASRVIKAPDDGAIGLEAVHEGSYVRAGQTLAIAYNPSLIYITARVPESDIQHVRIGDPAEVRLDAFPDEVITGSVEQLQPSAAGNFQIYPSTDIDPTNIQKIDQYVAVRIRPYAANDARLRPGLNATVSIRVVP